MINILNKPLYYNAKRNTNKFDLNIRPNENIILEKGQKYYISLRLVDEKSDGHISFPLYMKHNLVRDYTNGNSSDINSFLKYWDDELSEKKIAISDDVIGIAIGTRPDCVSDALLDYFEQLNRHTFVTIEYGIESANNDTLRRINRGHDFECARSIVEKTAERGINVGGHVILGLPGEDADESLRQAPVISALPLNMLKIHQLQVIKDTRLAEIYQSEPFHLYTVNEYISLITEYIQYLRKDLVLERFVSQSPKQLLIAPDWGLKNYEFTNLLNNHLKATGAYQGKKV